jgi:hypothetical protein
MRLLDFAAFTLVAAGWAWLAFGHLSGSGPSTTISLLALLPTAIWLVAGLTAALVFEISGLGYRSLLFWEAYLIILVLALFGVTSLRIALNPRDRKVHRGPVRPHQTPR